MLVGAAQLAEYVTEDAKAAFTTTLEDTENWLYEDGEDETKGVYIAKLEELQKIGDPIVQRSVEEQTRPGAAQVRRSHSHTVAQSQSNRGRPPPARRRATMADPLVLRYKFTFAAPVARVF